MLLRRRLAVLVAAAMMVLSMLVASAPVFAQGQGGCDPEPGATEGTRSNHQTPPTLKPGALHRDTTANDKDPGTSTGFGVLVVECGGTPTG